MLLMVEAQPFQLQFQIRHPLGVVGALVLAVTRDILATPTKAHSNSVDMLGC